MKKPEPQDFGLSDQEYTFLVAERAKINEAINKLPAFGLLGQVLRAVYISLILGGFVWIIFSIIGYIIYAIVAIIGFEFDEQIPESISYVVFIGGSLCFLIYFLNHLFSENQKSTQYQKQLIDDKFQKASQYEEAISRYEKTQDTYWKSLRGIKLEKAIAELYNKIGYSVQMTKASGDEGIDLILSKKDETIVVQCKGHEKPIGVGVVRDLYGSMMHYGANKAILVCPAGFTKGVVQFMTNKPIQLISADDLIRISDGISRVN
ncbi:MAG: restriction endonuclease [Sedimentisphaerales bacterium]|nr:restriction endonuclease [Sedimentisphaerales bacterium]